MQTIAVSGESPDPSAVARAVEVLRHGGLLIYPTDTLYALGGRAHDHGAVRRVREAKAREAGRALPLVAADPEQAQRLCAAWPEAARRLAERFWPGPLTLVLPAAAGLPPELTAGETTVAVRVPGLRLTRELCAAAGALVSTSANRAGAPPPVTCPDAVAAVGEAVELALDAGPGRPVGSTIVDLASDPPRLLRAGPVAWTEVRSVLLSASPC